MAKDMNDSATLELIPAAKKRGRPASGKALSNAERQRRFRENKKGRVQIELSFEDWALLSALLDQRYRDDSSIAFQRRYAHIVERVHLAGGLSAMPDWFEENRYKEPVTVTENQPVQESVTVTEIDFIEDKPVTVTKSRPKVVIEKKANLAGRPVLVDGVVVGYARRTSNSVRSPWLLFYEASFIFGGPSFKGFSHLEDVRQAAVAAYCRFVPDFSRITDLEVSHG